MTFVVGLGLGHASGPPAASASPTPARTAGGAARPTTTTLPPLQGPALADPGTLSQPTWVDRGDPLLVSAGGASYFYWTQPLPGLNVPVQTEPAGGTWGALQDALPTLPAWATPGATWAPEVHRFAGHWVLYFAAARAADQAMHCIGDAVGATPTGPFMPAPAPLVCPVTQGGSIDPRVFVTPGGPSYLLWKSDNNSTPGDGNPKIWSQRLAGSGLALLGRPAAIFTADQPWQAGMVEAPDLVLAQGRYWLFYSAGPGYSSADYAIGDASCAGPTGPCADQSASPLLASNQQGQGPGEESVYVSAAGDWLVYNPSCSDNNPRPTAIARLGFGPSGPYLAQS